MKQTIRFILFLVIFGFSVPSFSLSTSNISDIKDRGSYDLFRFTEVTGMTANMKPLSSAQSLGIWGANLGVEFTSIPQNAFQVFNTPLNLPAFFPRLNVAKGLTPALDLEASVLYPRILQSQINLPQEVKDLVVYGAGLKYTILDEEPLSLAIRATYNRLNLSFFHSDTYGADLSMSRRVSLGFMSVTPYVGAGYVSINGTFKKEIVDLLKASSTYRIEDYRYFTGASLKLFLLNITGQADFGNPKTSNTVSVKVGLDL